MVSPAKISMLSHEGRDIIFSKRKLHEATRSKEPALSKKETRATVGEVTKSTERRDLAHPETTQTMCGVGKALAFSRGQSIWIIVQHKTTIKVNLLGSSELRRLYNSSLFII